MATHRKVLIFPYLHQQFELFSFAFCFSHAGGWRELPKALRRSSRNILGWEFHGQKSLAGHSPWGCKQSGMTEQLGRYTVLPILQMRKVRPVEVKKLGAKTIHSIRGRDWFLTTINSCCILALRGARYCVCIHLFSPRNDPGEEAVLIITPP